MESVTGVARVQPRLDGTRWQMKDAQAALTWWFWGTDSAILSGGWVHDTGAMCLIVVGAGAIVVGLLTASKQQTPQ